MRHRETPPPRRKIPPSLAEALGLTHGPPLPNRSAIRFTRHAVAQYRARCAPDLELPAAAARLEQLVREHAQVQRHRPKWLRATDPSQRMTTIAYALVTVATDPPFALPIIADGGPIAVTCIRRERR